MATRKLWAPEKKSGSNSKVLIGVALWAWSRQRPWGSRAASFLQEGDTKQAGGGASPGNTASRPASPPTKEEEKKSAADEKPAVVPLAADAITNLLPGDAEGVCAVKLQGFIRTLSRKCDIPASPGSKNSLKACSRSLVSTRPISMSTSRRGDFTCTVSTWTMNIVHGIEPLARDAIVAATELTKAADAKIEDQEYVRRRSESLA